MVVKELIGILKGLEQNTIINIGSKEDEIAWDIEKVVLKDAEWLGTEQDEYIIQ